MARGKEVKEPKNPGTSEESQEIEGTDELVKGYGAWAPGRMERAAQALLEVAVLRSNGMNSVPKNVSLQITMVDNLGDFVERLVKILKSSSPFRANELLEMLQGRLTDHTS